MSVKDFPFLINTRGLGLGNRESEREPPHWEYFVTNIFFKLLAYGDNESQKAFGQIYLLFTLMNTRYPLLHFSRQRHHSLTTPPHPPPRSIPLFLTWTPLFRPSCCLHSDTWLELPLPSCHKAKA